MGQTQSITDTIIPETVDSLHMQVVRHAKVLAEINSLTYDDFKTCLENLNSLSRKCIDPNGKQLVFIVKRGSDTCLLWKATVKIACVKVDPVTRHIDSYKFLNLKQFLCVFKTFQAHLESLISSENQRSFRNSSRSPLSSSCSVNYELTASVLMDQVDTLVGSGALESHSNQSSPTISTCSFADHFDECSICLDRRIEVMLPCTHGFCTPCIEQWNVNNKSCPICSETLESTDDTWIMPELPGVEEINEKICAEFMNLAKKS